MKENKKYTITISKFFRQNNNKKKLKIGRINDLF